MRALVLPLAFMLLASVAVAGPNAGGVLWVHDTGIVYSTDTPLPPVSLKPAQCADVDNEQDADNTNRIWKVYAAFPPGSSPRLKLTAWGIEFPEAASSPYSYVSLNAAGCGVPGENGPGTDFWFGDFGFPTSSGGEVGLSFFHVRLTGVITLFYFTGAGYIYSGNDPVRAKYPNEAQDVSISRLWPPYAADSRPNPGTFERTHA
jgi:hypothetical protein